MSETNIPVGGDFTRIFDHRDYLAMIGIPDEATCILRGHLILEEVLNIWAAKLTKTEDLFRGTFVPFKTKLTIARNLGMPEFLFEVLDRINELRNRFSHRKGYLLETSAIDALRKKVDAMPCVLKLEPCATFNASVSGKNAAGEAVEKTYTWASGDDRIRFVITFVVLMLKITHWIQQEFVTRGIPYTIIAADVPKS